MASALQLLSHDLQRRMGGIPISLLLVRMALILMSEATMELLSHSVHWNICLLHANKLPFRALFAHYDGKTAGPTSFKGPIGKEQEEDLTKRPVVQFSPISNEEFPQLPDDVRADLSHDQQYLYEICSAVGKGEVSLDLAIREPGPIFHAHWVTRANRTVRCYASKKKPSCPLKRLTFAIIHFYAPS